MVNSEPSFNSKMVRLKVSIPKRNWDKLSCFNSKMVRLKGICYGMELDPHYWFQFQNGSIKRIQQ